MPCCKGLERLAALAVVEVRKENLFHGSVHLIERKA